MSITDRLEKIGFYRQEEKDYNSFYEEMHNDELEDFFDEEDIED